MSAEETNPLILTGDGYWLAISPEAEQLKSKLLTVAYDVQRVTDNDESAKAQFVLRQLAAIRIAVDKCRKVIKEPVLGTGKMIDQTAKDFLVELVDEEKRINDLIGEHAKQIERDRLARKEAERLAFEATRAAREAAALAAEKAGSTGKMSDIAAARAAEQERRESLAARMDASAELADTRLASGVRFTWDFEVVNLAHLYAAAPGFVELTPKRAEILSWIKTAGEITDEKKLIDALAQLGIRAFKRPVVSTR